MRFRQSIIPTVTLLVMSMGLFCGAEAKTIEAGHATVSWKGMGVFDDLLGDGDRVFSGTITGTILVKHLPEGSAPAEIHKTTLDCQAMIHISENTEVQQTALCILKAHQGKDLAYTEIRCVGKKDECVGEFTWVWGKGGWLGALGALDFAGGTVVHISSGVSALAAALVIGRRKGYGREPMQPHSLPLTVAGAALLWFGWFGFNAGSAVSAGKLATSAFVVTNTATAAAALGWMFTEWVMRGKPTVLGAASGAVAGLVAITPASGFVNPLASIVIGAVAGFLCYNACNVKSKLGYDDSLDVVGVHGIGGTWGAIATGLFATKTINPDGADGLFYGNPGQMKAQIIAVVASWVLAFVGTVIILKVLDAIMGLRVPEEDEVAGLDLSQHSETAYAAGGGYGEVGAGHPGAFGEARPRVAH